MYELFIFFQCHVILFSSDFFQFFLVIFDSSQLLFCEFCQILFCWSDKVIMNFDFSDSSNIGIIGQFRLQVEKYRQQKFLFWIDHLLIKTKTLNFRKVNIGLFRSNVISRKANNWFVFFIVQSVEDDGCLRWTNDNLLLHRFELPVNSRLCLSFKFYSVLFKVPHVLIFKLISLFLIIPNQSHMFTEYSVQWNTSKTASKY